MVRLDDGWLAIVEQLIEIDLEGRSPALSIPSEGVFRVRRALLARVEGTIEQEMAALLERIVLKELGSIPQDDLVQMAGGAVPFSGDDDESAGDSAFPAVDEGSWPAFEEEPD